MEYEQLQAFFIVLLGMCALIAAVSGACAAIVKFWRYAHKQSDENASKIADHEQRITRLEGCCDEVRGKLQLDWEFQQDEIEMNRLMLRSIKHLIQHSVDGNDTKKLEMMEQEIDDYLLAHAR